MDEQNAEKQIDYVVSGLRRWSQISTEIVQ